MNQTEPIHVGGRALGNIRHICAFFHNKEDEYRSLVGFIKEGLERKEKAFHIVDTGCRDAHRERLQREGIGVPTAERSGQLIIACWEDAYLKDGYFDQDRQLDLIETILQRGKTEGFPLTRLIANMEWALEDKAGVEDIVEYESRLNYVLPKYDDPVICTYDLSRFNAGIAMDILRTHPLVILGGMLQENPLYVQPDEFLRELQERRALSP
jgi:MEDS: MEthanogen/methylotroph, DcmR Sensory domain